MTDRIQNSAYIRLVLLVVSLFVFTTGFSQNKQELEAKRKVLKSEIAQINKLLTKTSKKEKNLLSHLGDINKKIEVRQKIINLINDESKAYSNEIKENNSEISSIETELKKLKVAYAKTVVRSYKSKNNNSKLLFLLSSSSFLQAYKRMQYMKQYASFRKNQAVEITTKKALLIQLNDSILLKKSAKDSLVNARIQERKIVDNEKAKQQKLIKKIKKKSNKYKREIRKKEKQNRAFEKKLENLIRGVITKSNKKSGKSTKQFVLTAEAKKLAQNFVANKGKLPAPVEKGYVSRYFGQGKHDVMKKIDVKSTGWHYTTPKNSKARAVFKGSVLGIVVDKNTKLKTVLIVHGNYVTSYRNLEKVTVSKGDKVETKQIVGTIHTNNTTGKTILKFGLWKNAKPQNPRKWLFRK
ncbi:MAG: peptidoglycan DD-metalloendopeptidase family protein [Flavobacteriaceae bacterium]